MSELRVDRIKHISAGASTPFLQLDSAGNVDFGGTFAAGVVKTNSLQNSSGGNLLAGGVVQVADNRLASVNDTYVSIADATNYDTPVSITFTPKFASSKLIIFAQCQTRSDGGFGMSAYLKRDGTFVNPSQNRSSLDFYYKGEARNHHFQIRVFTSVAAASTNATTFTLGITPYAGVGEFNYGWGSNYIQVWEIAA
jgi:hypothetical protein